MPREACPYPFPETLHFFRGIKRAIRRAVRFVAHVKLMDLFGRDDSPLDLILEEIVNPVASCQSLCPPKFFGIANTIPLFCAFVNRKTSFLDLFPYIVNEFLLLGYLDLLAVIVAILVHAQVKITWTLIVIKIPFRLFICQWSNLL